LHKLDFKDITEIKESLKETYQKIYNLRNIKKKIESDRYLLETTIRLINDEIQNYNDIIDDYFKIRYILKNKDNIKDNNSQAGKHFLRYLKKCPKCEFTYTHKNQLVVHMYEFHSY
jgi:hypothetical protein